MENSYRFFENKDCKYYPCHKGLDSMNCLFCYCPLYHLENCPGLNKYIEKNGMRIKVCTDCNFPHKAENYEEIVNILKSQNGK